MAKRGRPRVHPDDGPSHSLQARIRHKTWEALCAEAEDTGFSISALVDVILFQWTEERRKSR